jgi:hypothetical protein
LVNYSYFGNRLDWFKSFYFEKSTKMSKLLTNKSKKNNKNYSFIKKKLFCYKFLNFCLVKTVIIILSKILIVEFSIKSEFYIIQSVKFLTKKSHLLNLYIVSKKNIFSFTDSFYSKKLNKLFFVLFFFKQTFFLKNFIKGRVLSFFKKSFIIVINGFICLLPFNNCFRINFSSGKLNVFFISLFNEKGNKTLVLSQKSIYKKIHYTLLKMSSRILFKEKGQL